ncbi:response regulator [Ascidiimonas aurantiaca]|uniref:response regulator n=1 Tax=Ascidiimonas aurantiaca TaxID=1685432 RepID=UPI0030EFA292
MKPVDITCIIDDDPFYTEMLKRIIGIKRFSEQVLVFENGKEALDFFQDTIHEKDESKLPKLLLLDINMPEMDGWEFLNAFETFKDKYQKEIIIYLVSSSINPKDIMRAKEIALVTDYFVKPISISQLEHIFKSVSCK